jgi:hypothetical protein
MERDDRMIANAIASRARRGPSLALPSALSLLLAGPA